MQEPYSLDELQSDEVFGVHPNTLFEGDRKRVGALEVLNSGSAEGFHLFRRARHVATEAARVWAFRAVCEADGDAPDKLARLGELMSESHTSCRDDYACSATDLDELVALCQAKGAYGARYVFVSVSVSVSVHRPRCVCATVIAVLSHAVVAVVLARLLLRPCVCDDMHVIACGCTCVWAVVLMQTDGSWMGRLCRCVGA